MPVQTTEIKLAAINRSLRSIQATLKDIHDILKKQAGKD
jgi:hypothetical protein